MHAESATGICGLLPYPCGLMSSWAFVLGDSVLGDIVLGAFVRIPPYQLTDRKPVIHIFACIIILYRTGYACQINGHCKFWPTVNFSRNG